MKPPFDSSGGSTPAAKSQTSKPSGGGAGAPGAASTPAGVPDGLTQDLPDELSDLPQCLPGSCEALWNAVDKGMAPVTDAVGAATKVAGDVKDQATKTFDDAKAKAAKAVDEARETVKRNAEMARKYAELYQNDAKQAWAGLASVVTQQAGCAMQDAGKVADMLAPGARSAAAGKLDQYVDKAGRFVDGAGRSVADAGRSAEQAAAGYAKDGMDALAAGRKSMFDTIYPAMKFYQENGLDKLKECGSIPGRPEVPDALTDALEQIDKGTAEGIRAGSDMIAQYEQSSVVEKAIYEAERYRDEGLGELASMTDALRSGITDAIPLSSSCGGPPLPFDRSLLDPGAAEQYYHKLMNEFETMGKNARDKMIDDVANQVAP